MAVYSCGKENQPEEQTPEEQPSTEFTYSFSIDASKGPESKALALVGNTLNATWAEGEEVTVYNETTKEALYGTLLAQSPGASTTLKGELYSSKGIHVNDVLTLKFLSPEYNNQEGTLEYIAAHCDYATASVTVTSVDGGDIRTGEANFENQQAIVKFSLVHPDGYNAILTKSLKLVVDDMIIRVSLAHTSGDVYVAIPAISGKKIVLGASDYYSNNNEGFYYMKPSASFEKGKYYAIDVNMKYGSVVFNEDELNYAISSLSPYVVLGSDIPLYAYVKVGQYNAHTITIDLNGHCLSRSLSAADANGHVIEVFEHGNLTIVDSSGDRSGSITGGWANNGGGICNYGTLTIQGVRITGCKAAQQGGGIKNNAGATLTVISSIITGNSAPNGGGIYNIEGGTMTISGIEVGSTLSWCSISNNTATEDGGGIVNRGTATITAAYISNNEAANSGGGIWNSGTLSIATQYLSVEIKNNTCNGEGGGLWNRGTLNMHGVINVKNNTNVYAAGVSSNLYLKDGTKINVTGLFAGACEIHVYTESYQTRVITSGYQNTNSWSNQFILSDVDGFNIRFAGSELEFYKTASGDPIRYIDRTWDEGSYKIVETPRMVFAQNIATVGAEEGQANIGGYYYASGDFTTKKILYASDDLHLILCDGASLTANCLVSDEHSIHIYGQAAGTGRFTATDPDSGYPGIGCHAQDGTDIIICGGVITVKGSFQCSGIGGGYIQVNETTDSHHNCANISIFGGTVSATGGSEAAGIGGSCHSVSSGNVYIYGGSVTAQGGASPIYETAGGGAGIGGGDYCALGGQIFIKGGTVNATGGSEAAGIGVGQNSDNSQNGLPVPLNIYISGGDVTAYGGDRSAGIGSGDGVSGCKVYISGGTVRAYAGTDGAGIGSGEGATGTHGGRIEITGGFVEAWGEDGGAGIGAGEGAALGELIIKGGTVLAHGGDNNDANAICTFNESGTNSLTIGKTMRLRIGDNILSYTERAFDRLKTYPHIQIEPCPHSGNPCDWCMYGR